MLITYCLRKNVQTENASTYLRFVNVTCHKSHSKSLLLIQQTKITFQATVSLFKRDNLSRFIHIHQVLFISVKISVHM